jgi:OOP family OmpA-OmpF porin
MFPKIFITIVFLFAFLYPAQAQFDILNKVKEKVEEKAKEKTGEAIDKATEPKEEEKEADKKESKNEEMNKDENKSARQTDELKSYSKYDFIPGEQVLYFDDFSQDNAGDFPALWNTNSSGEVVTLNNFPGNWFQPGLSGTFLPETKGTFGENFTVEFDLIYAPTANSNLPSFDINFFSAKEDEAIDAYVSGNGGCAFRMGATAIGAWNWKDQQYGPIDNQKDNNFLQDNINKKVRVSFSFQKQRVRFWLNENKIFDLPKLLMTNIIIDKFKFITGETDDQKPYFYITNLRVAVGQPDTRSKLLTEGKLVTRGILFDVNSDKIKPESYGTLKDIAKVLKDNSNVKVKIVGHTDSDGNENSNLDLSKRRAVSVKNSLVEEFGIEAGRMETDGKGELEPVSDNNTPEGKANNRRVEFIKI